MNRVQYYIRLLTYEQACKVIDFVLDKGTDDYANITVGGVSLSVTEGCLKEIREFCSKSFPRFEIGQEHPHKVNQKIVQELRTAKII